MSARRFSIRLCWISLTLATVGCSDSSVPMVAGRPVRSDQITDFTTLYGQNCTGCHGADGEFGPSLPLNDPLFLAIVPDSVLLDLVQHGRPGTAMPAFSRKKGGTLTDEQVKAIASGIKPRWKAKAIEPPPPVYLVGDDATRGDLGRGRVVFDRACASCHGADGRGGKDKVGPIHDPSLLALVSDQAIRRTVITGRRDFKMPDYAGKMGRSDAFEPLSPAEITDVVALVASWRTGPPMTSHTPPESKN